MTIKEALLNILPYVADPDDMDLAAEKGLRFSEIYAQLRARVDDLPSERSVRRVMTRMSDYIDHVGHTNAARWFKVRNTNMLSSDSRMNVNTAIALTTLQRMAARQLPGAVYAGLAARFEEARATLDLDGSEAAQKGRSWDAKIMRIVGAQPLIAPPIEDEIYHSVTDALLRERQIDIRYQPNTLEARVADYGGLSPFGLLEGDGVFYLVAQTAGKMRMFRLDRMKSVKVRRDSVVPKPGFNLATYVKKQGIAEFRPEPEVELKLRIHAREGQYARTAAQHQLTQFKLSEDQQIVEWAEDKQSFVLTATIRPSVSLRNYLHGQSDTVEVLAPASMREEFAERIRRMAKRYAHKHRE
ncbi:WYL domain-containing protein [Paraburkholderia sp. Ac-20347]|uniref:helix-turn-helix transcriptional regulator n=1 Tax=Paraburkholderia sp. Ac-20347 TaxID=2703892 RepID=UPI0019820E89|nr:WYL domain-containing protein [Paraburkholderia sp. Ac-20347]MBN3808966.1 WYL domain-containing protein [Paraburkholderia sp. Ac-20347]